MTQVSVKLLVIGAVAAWAAVAGAGELPELGVQTPERSASAAAPRRAADQASQEPPQFVTGKPYDRDLGVYLFKPRHYSSDLCRWTTPDPSGFPASANNFVQVNNRVTNARGPDGLSMRTGKSVWRAKFGLDDYAKALQHSLANLSSALSSSCNDSLGVDVVSKLQADCTRSLLQAVTAKVNILDDQPLTCLASADYNNDHGSWSSPTSTLTANSVDCKASYKTMFAGSINCNVGYNISWSYQKLGNPEIARQDSTTASVNTVYTPEVTIVTWLEISIVGIRVTGTGRDAAAAQQGAVILHE